MFSIIFKTISYIHLYLLMLINDMETWFAIKYANIQIRVGTGLFICVFGKRIFKILLYVRNV